MLPSLLLFSLSRNAAATTAASRLMLNELAPAPSGLGGRGGETSAKSLGFGSFVT